MKSNTTAFLAFWNGLRDLSVLAEYERWHSIEHVPERLSVPGILEARRYGSLESAGQFFTGYWLADLAALKNAAYQALLQHPTPWSARMRLQLTNFVRHPAQRLGSAGVTRGKALATLLLTRPAAVPLQEALRHLAQQLGQVVTAGVLLRAEWFLVVDEGLSQHPLGLQGTDNVPPEARVVLLLEHSTPQALQAFLASPEALPTSWVAQAPARYFGLLSTIAQADLYPDGLLARPAARVDLMP